MNETKEMLKTLLRKAINNSNDDNEKGQWITVKGTHVFIPEGANQEEVVEKFLAEKQGNKSETKKETSEKQEEKKEEKNEEKHGFKKDKDSGYYMKDLSDGTSVYVEKKEGGQGEKEPFYLEATHFDKDGKVIDKKQYHYDSMDGMFSKIDRDFSAKDKQGLESELGKLTDKQIIQKKGSLISKIATAQRLDQQDKLKELDKEYNAIVKEQNKRLKSDKQGSEGELSKLSDDEINEKKGLLISKIATAQRLDQQDKLKELDKEYAAIVKEQNKRLKSDNSIQNGLEKIINNFKPETEEDIKILKGLKDILEKE